MTRKSIAKSIRWRRSIEHDLVELILVILLIIFVLYFIVYNWL